MDPGPGQQNKIKKLKFPSNLIFYMVSLKKYLGVMSKKIKKLQTIHVIVGRITISNLTKLRLFV